METFEETVITSSLSPNYEAEDMRVLILRYIFGDDCNYYKKYHFPEDNEMDVILFHFQINNNNYFYSDMRIKDKHIYQLSSIKGNVVYMIYSSKFPIEPAIIYYINDLQIFAQPVRLITYSQHLAFERIYRFSNEFEDAILCAPKIADWYIQRIIVAKVLDIFLRNDSNCLNIQTNLIRLNDDYSFYTISFTYKNQLYYWIDYLQGTNVHFSHLEKLSGNIVELLYASDSETNQFIPRYSAQAVIPLFYNKITKSSII